MIEGTPGPDLLIGTPGDDIIYGFGGDVLEGRAGNDTLRGGPGKDLLAGSRATTRCGVASDSTRSMGPGVNNCNTGSDGGTVFGC